MAQDQGEDRDASGDPIIEEAQERFDRCQTRESRVRTLWWSDMQYAMADSDNGYQWPNDIKQTRQIAREPSLTINKIRQHCLQLENDAKQNKPSIKFRPTGGGATFESAQALQAIVRHIEYISSASVAYDTASQFQIRGGLGFFLITHGYLDEESFDQEIFINRIPDPLKVYQDPDIKELDGSDANFGFVFDDVQVDEFPKLYPEYEDVDLSDSLQNPSDWMDTEYVRVATYFRKTLKRDKLLSFVNPDTGERKQAKRSDIPEDVAKLIEADPSTMSRRIKSDTVEWFFIVGNKVVDQGVFPSKYIPIVRVVGEEVQVNGILERKGHVRNLKDPQRMYNFWTSSATAQVALQTKTPFIAPVRAIAGYEVQWRTANISNYSVLPYNDIDEEGNPIARPERADPPQIAQAYVTGMQIAINEMAMVSGQFAPQMGEPSNERSAKAINERQRKGDNATYHFIDNMATAIRFAGKIILDMIPRIYDTQRIMRVMAEDGMDFDLQLNPQAFQVYQEHQNHDGEVVARILNPSMGKYEVEADVGPNFATQRQEAFNAISLILAENPALTQVIGDILFRAADFPGADEIAMRLRRMVPPQALGQGPTQNEQQLQQQLTVASQALSKSLEELAGEKNKVKSKDMLRDIDAYEAETKRLAVMLQHVMDDNGQVRKMLTAITTKLNTDMASTDIGGISDKAEQDLGVDEQPPVPGAKKAPDGQWYLSDPSRSGKYLQVQAATPQAAAPQPQVAAQ